MANLLVIDDENDITEVIQIYLEDTDHQITCLNSASDGLKWSKDNQVDLLITDILMPSGMNGLELIADIKEYCPDVKILAISGGGASGGVVKAMALESAMELGAERALSKPFTKEELLRRVDKLLKGT
ncbi:MAG: DNA-binding NtrC family response regulator [Bacteriovoracaceae bacterium]|jgi:DNA-binding NtrC family response regulator